MWDRKQQTKRKSKEAIKGYNIFLTGCVAWLKGYCTILLFSHEYYPRPCAFAFSGEVLNKFALLRTVPRPQYFDYILFPMQPLFLHSILHNSAPSGINNSLLSIKVTFNRRNDSHEENVFRNISLCVCIFMCLFYFLKDYVDPFDSTTLWVLQKLSHLSPQKVKLPVYSSAFLNLPSKEGSEVRTDQPV